MKFRRIDEVEDRVIDQRLGPLLEFRSNAIIAIWSD